MTAHLITRSPRLSAPWTRRYLVAAGGAALALTLATGLVVGVRQSAARPAVAMGDTGSRPSTSGAPDPGNVQRPIPAAIYEQIGAAAAPEQQRPIPLSVYQSLGSAAAAESRHPTIPYDVCCGNEHLPASSATVPRQQPIPEEVYLSQ